MRGDVLRFISYVWLGLVLGVSFLATPIKFQAQSLTLPVALDVGQTTFHAFGKLEVALTVIIVITAIRARSVFGPRDWFLLNLVVIVVAAQMLWLIPRLDVRVEAIIAGETLPGSHLHSIYAGIEFVKALALLALGTSTAKRI